MDIDGASAIVTGGASGIGAASARQLAAKGARVVVADLQADRGAELAEEIGGVFVSGPAGSGVGDEHIQSTRVAGYSHRLPHLLLIGDVTYCGTHRVASGFPT